MSQTDSPTDTPTGTPEGRTWDVEWIQSVLPHRYPMLLVDRVLEIEPEQRIVAIKNVTATEEEIGRAHV